MHSLNPPPPKSDKNYFLFFEAFPIMNLTIFNVCEREQSCRDYIHSTTHPQHPLFLILAMLPPTLLYSII